MRPAKNYMEIRDSKEAKKVVHARPVANALDPSLPQLPYRAQLVVPVRHRIE